MRGMGGKDLNGLIASVEASVQGKRSWCDAMGCWSLDQKRDQWSGLINRCDGEGLMSGAQLNLGH